MWSGVAKIQRHASSHCETAMPEISEKLKKLMKISPVVLVGQTLMVTLLVSLKNNENYRINKVIIFIFCILFFSLQATSVPYCQLVIANNFCCNKAQCDNWSDVGVIILRLKILESSTHYYFIPSINESSQGKNTSGFWTATSRFCNNDRENLEEIAFLSQKWIAKKSLFRETKLQSIYPM